MDGIVARQYNKGGAGQSFLGGAETIAIGKEGHAGRKTAPPNSSFHPSHAHHHVTHAKRLHAHEKGGHSADQPESKRRTRLRTA